MTKAATAVRAERARPTAPPVATPPPAVVLAPNGPATNGHDAGPRADAHGPLGPVHPARVRKPLGQLRVKLDNTPIAGFHAQWFNDDKDRIKEALEAGYAHISDDEGKPLSKVVGTKKEGGGLIAYRMKLPIGLWQQDQDAKVGARRQRQHDMRQGVTGTGRPGEDGRYQPTGPDNKPLTNIRNESR